jgi:hypothetical protein
LPIVLSPLIAQASTAGAPRCANVYQSVVAKHSNPEETIRQFASRYGIDLEKNERPLTDNAFAPSLPGFLPFNTYELRKSFYAQKDQVEFLSPQATSEIAAMPVVRTEPVLGDSVTHHPEIQGEIWQLSTGESFHWMNVGSSLLLEDGSAENFPKAAEVLAKQHPGQPLRIAVPYNPRWLKARDALLKRQMVTSIKITNRYEKEKPYLNPEQLFGLRQYDTEEPNASDYFVVLDETARSPLLLSPEEFKAHTVAALRLARYEYRSSMDRGILLGPESLGNELPHASRVRGKLAKKLRELWGRLTREKNLRVTEISRVNRFGQVPKPVMRALFMKALQSAKNPKKPTDLFVLECDDSAMATAAGRPARTLVDYYREEYGFEILVQVNDPTEPGPAEYLMYLDTHSDRYRQVMTKLAAETGQMKTQPAPQLPPVETWSHGWNLQDDYLMNSPTAKIRKGMMVIQSHFNEFKKQPLVNLSSDAKDTPRNFTFDELNAFLKNMNVPFIESALNKLNSDSQSAAATDRLREILLERESGLSYPMTAKILVLGENASLHARFLKTTESRRQIRTEWPQDQGEKFDNVILSSVLTQHDSAERAAILQRASNLLRPDGEIIIIDNIIGKGIGDTDLSVPTEALAQAKLSATALALSGMPLTKSQIVATVALEYDQNRQRRPLPLQSIQGELKAAGFATDTWSGNGHSLRFHKSP